MGKILHVNMADLTIKEENNREYQLLGGRALIAKYLLTQMKPAAEPLGKNNILIFAPGILGGSRALSSGRISLGAKSPLTGGIKESNGGGVVGLKMGRLGYQAVVIEDKPPGGGKYILRLNTEGAELIAAEKYWGQGVYRTAKQLRSDFGNDVAVSCIGPAGENQFLAAGVANTDGEGVPSRYCGRGGLGAVMGSKGLKALVIDDTGAKPQEPAMPLEFKAAMEDYIRILNESPVVEAYKIYGTAAMVQVTNAVGGLPTRNFTTGRFEGADKISGETMYELIVRRKGKPTHACMPGCLIRCSNVYVDGLGREIVAPLEYETIALMGSNLAIDDLDIIARLNYLCNDYGLDTVEVGATLGVAMAGGLISFGDGEGAIKLVHEIGKGSLVGRVLGMGAATAGKVLGVTDIPVVKGQAMPGYEPRGIKGLGVTYATSPMGADHTAGSTARAKINHHSPDGQGEMSKKMQYTIPIYDALGLCMFAVVALGAYPQVLSQLVNAQLGTALTEKELSKLAADTIKWELEFNRLAGFTRQDDRLPEFFREKCNPASNTVFDVSEEDLDRVHGT